MPKNSEHEDYIRRPWDNVEELKTKATESEGDQKWRRWQTVIFAAGASLLLWGVIAFAGNFVFGLVASIN